MPKKKPKPPAAPQTLADLGERAFLRRVRAWFAPQTPAAARALPVPIGDDAAALALPSTSNSILAVTTDALIEGVHFDFAWTPPRDLGAKALVVNLSDLAAMAARPLAAFLALSVPPSTPLSALRDFFMGLRAESRRHGCPLAGGDLTRAPQWAITITVLGLPAAGNKLALRSAARPGQSLYVTGCPGESGAGLAALRAGIRAPRLINRHNRPEPRLPEAAVLAGACPDLALLDVSDGIWNDAGQFAEASGVRVELDREKLSEAAAGIINSSPPMRELCRQKNIAPLDWVLFGGEDYELLFATKTDLESLKQQFAKAGLKTAIRKIGRISKGHGVHLILAGGQEQKVSDKTFSHFEK